MEGLWNFHPKPQVAPMYSHQYNILFVLRVTQLARTLSSQLFCIYIDVSTNYTSFNLH